MTGHEILQTRLGVDPERIEDFCRRWGIKEMSLFGSVVGEDFREDSDVDVLVTFEDPHRSFGPWMSEWFKMEEELETIFGREVDLVEREVIERSENYIRRRAILRNPQPIYVSR